MTNGHPEYVVPESNLLPVCDGPKRMAPIPPSRMFLVKESLKVFRAKHPDREVFNASQGDGGASLPGVPHDVLDEAHRLQKEHGTSYDLPGGCELFRASVIEDYWQADPATGLSPSNVLDGAGGRDVLNKAYEAMLHLGCGRTGDVIVTSRVPWISYNWGPYGLGANVMRAPGDPANGWAYSPEGIRECVELAKRDGRCIAGIIITSPDNPTGHALALDDQVALGKAAFAAGVNFVLFDWIYHRVTDAEPYDVNRFLPQFDDDERPRVIIMDGITKCLGGSNIRNAHLLASERVVKFIQSRASHGVIPSFHSQAVAVAAYRMGIDKAAASIIGPTNASRQIVRDFAAANGLTAICDQGYYALIDVGKWVEAAGMEDSAALGQYLGENHGVAIVPGVFFSPHAKDWVRFSYAQPPERTRGSLERLVEGLHALE